MNSTWVSYPCLYWKTNEDLHFFYSILTTVYCLGKSCFPMWCSRSCGPTNNSFSTGPGGQRDTVLLRPCVCRLTLAGLIWQNWPASAWGNHVTLRISQGLGACFTSSFSNFLFYKICVHSLFTVCSEKIPMSWCWWSIQNRGYPLLIVIYFLLPTQPSRSPGLWNQPETPLFPKKLISFSRTDLLTEGCSGPSLSWEQSVIKSFFEGLAWMYRAEVGWMMCRDPQIL